LVSLSNNEYYVNVMLITCYSTVWHNQDVNKIERSKSMHIPLVSFFHPLLAFAKLHVFMAAKDVFSLFVQLV